MLKALSMHHQWISGFLCRIIVARCTISSPQASFGVRSSRIHFSPTEEKWMRDERTRIWPILLQLWSPSFCAPRLEYSSSRACLPTVFFSFLSLSIPLCFSRYLDCKIRSTIEFFSGEERRLCVILVTLWQLILLENEIFYPSQYLTGNKFSLTFCKFSLAFLQPCKQLFVILNQMSWHVVTFCISLLVCMNLYEIWAYHLCDIEFYCCCSIYP